MADITKTIEFDGITLQHVDTRNPEIGDRRTYVQYFNRRLDEWVTIGWVLRYDEQQEFTLVRKNQHTGSALHWDRGTKKACLRTLNIWAADAYITQDGPWR